MRRHRKSPASERTLDRLMKMRSSEKLSPDDLNTLEKLVKKVFPALNRNPHRCSCTSCTTFYSTLEFMDENYDTMLTCPPQERTTIIPQLRVYCTCGTLQKEIPAEPEPLKRSKSEGVELLKSTVAHLKPPLERKLSQQASQNHVTVKLYNPDSCEPTCSKCRLKFTQGNAVFTHRTDTSTSVCINCLRPE